MKWHALYHSCEDVKCNGSMFHCSAELYEYDRIIFKRKYGKKSKMCATAMNETIEKVWESINWSETLVESINKR